MSYYYCHKNHHVAICDENKRTYYYFISNYNIKELEVQLKNKSIISIIKGNRHTSSLNDIFDILVKENYNKIVTEIIKEYNIPYIYVDNFEEEFKLPF